MSYRRPTLSLHFNVRANNSRSFGYYYATQGLRLILQADVLEHDALSPRQGEGKPDPSSCRTLCS